MKMFRGKIGLLSIVAVFVFAFVACGVAFRAALWVWQVATEEKYQLSQERVLEVVAALQGNMSRDEVRQVFREYEWTSFVDKNGEIGLWTYPPQPYATDWIVRLFFEDDKLVAVRYVNSDNIEKHAPDAPPDILFNSGS